MDLLVVLIVFHEYFPQTQAAWWAEISGWYMDVHWQPAGRRSARSDGRFGLKVRGQLNLHFCCTTTRYSSLQQGGIKHVSVALVSLVWIGKAPHSPTTPSSNLGRWLHLSLKQMAKVKIRAGLCVLDEWGPQHYWHILDVTTPTCGVCSVAHELSLIIDSEDEM